MNDDSATTPTQEIPQPPKPLVPQTLAVELAATDFGSIVTNPLFSRVIQSVLGMVVVFIGTKVFKMQEADIHVQDYVELLVVLIGSIAAVWYRMKSKGAIKDPVAMAQDLLPTLQQAVSPAVRRDLLNLIQIKNPKVYEILKQML